MGKMSYLIMGVIAIQIALIIVFNTGVPGASVYSFWTNPSGWDLLNFAELTESLFLSVSALAFIGGVIFKNDILIFASFSGVLYTFGKQLVGAWQNMASQPFLASATELAQAQAGTLHYYQISSLLASLIIGTICVLYIFTVIEFWRGRD
jgi:hypothetical protein